MFKELRSLDRDAHRELRFVAQQPYHFAAHEMLIPIVAGEASVVAREYAIVFLPDKESPPSALVGVQEGVNAHVLPSGQWAARYIPAHVRRYPFMLVQSPSEQSEKKEEGRSFVMVFDQKAPHLNESTGERLIEDDGQPSPILKRIQEVLLKLQQDLERTRHLIRQIHEAGLLVERVITVETRDGESRALKGFRVVDTDKLNGCSPETLQSLMNSGALLLIFSHLISMTNLRDGHLARTSDKPPHGAAEVSLDEIFGESKGDVFKFS